MPITATAVTGELEINDNPASTDTRTLSITLGSRTNGLLTTQVAVRAATGLTSITATWNGSAMTVDLGYNPSGAYRIAKLSLPVGSGDATARDLVVAFNGLNTAASLQGHIVYSVYDGAAQTTPTDQTAQATGTSNAPAVNITPTEDGELILGTLVSEANVVGTPSGETVIHDMDGGAWVTGATYVIQGTAGTQAVDWSIPTTDFWAVGAVSYKAASSGASVSLPAIPSGSQLHAPSVAYAVAAPTIASGSQLAPPTISPSGSLELPAIPSGSQLLSPSLAYALSLPAIPAGSTLYSPSLALTLALPAIPSGSQLHAPSLAYLVQLPTVDSGSQLHPPALSTGNNLLLPAIPAGSALHPPALAYALSLPVIAAGSQLHAPSLSQGDLLPPSILSGAQLFGPALAYAVSLPAIPSSVTVNPPSLALGISLPAIPSGTTLHPPAVTSFTVTLPTLASTVVLYAPTVSGGETDALIIVLDAGAWTHPRLASASWTVPGLKSASWTVPVLLLGGF